MRFLLALLALALAAAGCASPSYYAWGRYEDSVFAVTSTPDGFDLGAEIDSLEKQVQATIDAQKPVPPGLHAHLGYLHTVAGNPTAARQHFEQEKALFPESARLMENLLARLEAQA
jgi:hypothetical protein